MGSDRSQDRRNRLAHSLRGKEYRDAFFSEHINSGVSLQIRANRLARGLTQAELGKRADMKQGHICRLENPDFGTPNLQTLVRLAAAFDCSLIVRFAPFSELVDWTLGIADRGLVVPSFDSEFGEPPPAPTPVPKNRGQAGTAKPWAVPRDIDKECVALCRAINRFPGIATTESCCGHGKESFKIWFSVENICRLPMLLYWLNGCHTGVYGWRVCVTTDCGMSPPHFCVESEGQGNKAYADADTIAKRMEEYLENPADVELDAATVREAAAPASAPEKREGRSDGEG